MKKKRSISQIHAIQISEYNRTIQSLTAHGVIVRGTRGYFQPPVDVVELAHGFIVVMEIAGINPSQLNILLTHQVLTMSGRRERPTVNPAAYHQVEIGYGDFRVDVTFPVVLDRDRITATYRDGFLTVELPRRTETTIHVVDITQTVEAENETNES